MKKTAPFQIFGTNISLLVFIVYCSTGLATGATLYRAPDNLFSLTLPANVKKIETIEQTNEQIFHDGYILQLNDRHLTIHMKAERTSTKLQGGNFAESYEENLKQLPHFRNISRGEEEYSDNRFVTFFYSFTWKDSAQSPVYRYDGLTLIGNALITIYMEGSKKGVFFNIGTFKDILQSLLVPSSGKTPSSLSQRLAQFKNNESPSISSGKNAGESQEKPEVREPVHTPERMHYWNDGQTAREVAIPKPPVLIHGEPPLTVKTIAAWKALVEWTALTRLTYRQEQDLIYTLKEHFKKGEPYTTQVTSFAEKLSPYTLYALQPPQSKDLRERLTMKFTEMSQRSDGTNDGWNIFERVFYSKKAIVTKGEPPLTMQSRDGAIELMIFVHQLLENPTTKATIETHYSDSEVKALIQLSANLRHSWTDLTKVEREAICDILFQWSEIRIVWPVVSDQTRKTAATELQKEIQKICILSGFTRSSKDLKLSTLYLKAATVNPTILPILAANLSASLKKASD